LNLFGFDDRLEYLSVLKINEAPRSKLRGIKVELRRSRSNVKDIAELIRLRSDELRRGSPCLSSLQPRWAGSPLCYDKLQGIQAKANKQ
jgi:hypothetical protein